MPRLRVYYKIGAGNVFSSDWQGNVWFS